MVGCLGDETIGAYVEGALDVGTVLRVDHHIDVCTRCRSQLSAVAALPVSFVAKIGHSEPALELVGALATTRPGDPLGDLPIGRYIAETVIGRGGMGVVVRARDPELERAIAIKLVDAIQTGAWRTRLRGEARAMAKLRHPNVVAVFDAGTIGQQVFVAMDLVDGESLARHLDHDRRGALGLCIAAGRGLCAAHAAGLVHGDVKPDNILVDRDGRALVGDFGLARSMADGHDCTALIGTPAYMAPEQLRRDPATAASDQFALAVTVHEALSGRRPWRAESIDELERAIELEPPARPPEISRRVWRVIERALAPDPSSRYPTLSAFVDDLEAVSRPRRARFIAAGAVAFAGIAIAVVLARPGAASCADPVDRANAMTLAASCSGETPCAALIASLGAQAAAWRRSSVGVCEATRDGRQSAELLDHRMRCLEDRRREQVALVDQLHVPIGNADAFDAIAALDRFEPAERCETIDRATTTLPLPLTPGVAVAEQWIATANADYELGHYQAGFDELAPHLAEIRALGHPAIVAAGSSAFGEIQMMRGDLDSAEAAFDAALGAAAEARDDDGTAGILLSLAHLQGALRQLWPRDAELLRAADAAVVRAGRPPKLQARLLSERGFMAMSTGDLAAARVDFSESVELRRKLGQATAVAMSLQHLCDAEDAGGKLAEGRAHCEEALGLLRSTFGASHPLVAEAEINFGVALATAGDAGGAQHHWETALATLEHALGDDAPALATVLVDLVDGARLLGDDAAADRYMARAVAVSAHAPSTADGLDVQELVGNSLRQRGKLDESLAVLAPLARRAEASLGLAHRTTVRALEDLGTVYFLLQRFGDARPIYDKAVEGASKLYGATSPSAVELGMKAGEARVMMDDDAGACPLFERAALALEGNAQADSPFLAEAYTNLAICSLALGHTARAVEAAQKGLAIREGRNDNPLQTAQARFALGQAMWRANHARDAVAMVRRARDELHALGPHAGPIDEVDHWLAGAR